MRENPYSRDACIIGEVKREPQGIVAMRTGFGGTGLADMLVGERDCREFAAVALPSCIAADVLNGNLLYSRSRSLIFTGDFSNSALAV